ncbi:Tmk Thymidylate kinase, partial [uncultured Caudovirales phage]
MTLATSLPRGRFIVLEGVDGSGKTTQLQALADWLPTSGLMPQGARLITTRAPGGTVLGQALRGLLLHPPSGAEPCPVAELMLYAADIGQLTAQVIEPALAAGNWVLCDRFTGSTMAYQGYGRGLDLVLIEQLNQMATSGLEPDLTLWLDLSPVDSLRRRGHRLADRMEAVRGTFLDRVVGGYATENSSNNSWSAIDASQGIEAVTVACQMALKYRRFTLGRSKIHPRKMVALPVRAALERLVELQDDTRPTSAIVGDWADAIAAARAVLATEPVEEGQILQWTENMPPDEG